jgi:hypothetical protein
MGFGVGSITEKLAGKDITADKLEGKISSLT